MLTDLNLNDKPELRKKLLDLRSQLALDFLSEANWAINKNLSFLWVEGGGLGSPRNRPIWAGFKAFRNEPDPSQAIFESSPFIRWAFPRVVSAKEMELLEPAATNALWMKSSWGIWEPSPQTSARLSVNDCTGVLVPGLAFDRKGHRLGYGKGHYDRTLSGFKGVKVGVTFSEFVFESLPVEAQDVAMDFVVTDKEIIRLRPVER
ncbi:MAG: 5-formyltetrahydrofolate cyclo-ligase [Oligoflexia bacterium]|nr:5-formyltetrahydrofolate cyclo-ligase [Oligoflexia bacterium]